MAISSIFYLLSSIFYLLDSLILDEKTHCKKALSKAQDYTEKLSKKVQKNLMKLAGCNTDKFFDYVHRFEDIVKNKIVLEKDTTSNGPVLAITDGKSEANTDIINPLEGYAANNTLTKLLEGRSDIENLKQFELSVVGTPESAEEIL